MIRFALYFKRMLITVLILASTACTLPSDGPNGEAVVRNINPDCIQLVDIDPMVVQQLLRSKRTPLFSDCLGKEQSNGFRIGPGDVLDFTIWEIPPATLFSSSIIDASGRGASNMTQLPPQMVSQAGYVNIPFAGKIKASGLQLEQIQNRVRQKLQGKANNPQVLVRLINNATSNATIVGEVITSLRFPLTPGKERLLDGLAAASGVKPPVNKAMIQITRAGRVYALPLDVIIRDPRQNIILKPGDVVTALFQSKSFISLGATGKSEEINFEAQGITLAQALGRSGGLQDFRADARGVFIFRFEDVHALDCFKKPLFQTADGKVPVIYRLDLKNPQSFFVAQDFPIQDRDILYVSNASAVEIQKFLGMLSAVVVPFTPYLYLSGMI